MKTSDKIKWIRNVAKSLKTLASQEKPGMTKARLGRVRVQMELIAAGMEKNEKET